jgi:hypothetical protein
MERYEPTIKDYAMLALKLFLFSVWFLVVLCVLDTKDREYIQQLENQENGENSNSD